MKRAKIGDVYYMKLPNGYKLYQWAYRMPQRGDFIRVFDGLYNKVPSKEYIEKLVKKEHSYIINFNAGGVYRKELAFLIDNYPVPEEYPFPNYMIRFSVNEYTKRVAFIEVLGILEKMVYIYISMKIVWINCQLNTEI